MKKSVVTTVVLPEHEEGRSFHEILALLNTIITGMDTLELRKNENWRKMLGITLTDVHSIMHATILLKSARNRLIDSAIDYENLYQDISDQKFVGEGNTLQVTPERSLRGLFDSAGLDYDRLVKLLDSNP